MCSEMSRGERGDSLSVRLSVPAGGSLWTRQLQDCHRDTLRATKSSCNVPLSESTYSWSNYLYQVGWGRNCPFSKVEKIAFPKRPHGLPSSWAEGRWAVRLGVLTIRAPLFSADVVSSKRLFFFSFTIKVIRIPPLYLMVEAKLKYSHHAGCCWSN